MTTDEKWMTLALELARKGIDRTSPNPCVGAVIVKGGKILGKGWHKQAGRPHAEIEAIRDAKRNGVTSFKHATMYVTLEPCCTHGRTPPCTEAIIGGGFKRVVIGATDPNPHHAGRAFKILRQAGIEVTHGVLAKESEELNRAFNHWIVTGKPWVIAKAALTLDGALTTKSGRRTQITAADAQRDAHKLRAISDAILIGAETLRIDHPRLTVRGVKTVKQPLRVVVTRSGKLPGKSPLFTDANRESTLVYRNQSWNRILRDLGKRGVTRLLVEGGGEIHNQLAKKKLVDEVVLYYAPLMANRKDLPHADALRKLPLADATLTMVGKDLKLQGIVRR
ncbi:MAG: bifunctional diaminohydroxyphosphoribosylaminopyrimidine deaminase/5-amino-6-(5-phosphoribosylamino)uracil reductase RibD [Verrucomicrobiales bacterium]|nr:bifunctional diaminohydroxyphosphoribosylaminopyrimidine deaminase/5-amino-6-(5-phosphoribosylamino)uracil reductase RibD [Verrucomicrobiales bacterium]